MSRSGAERIFVVIAVVVVAVTGWVLWRVMAPAEEDGFSHELITETGEDEGGVRRKAGEKREKPAPIAEEKPEPPPRVIEATAKTIVGTVTDDTGEPIVEAKITTTLYFPTGELNYGTVASHQGEATTDEAGRFEVSVPGHGAYRVTARHPLYQPWLDKKVRAGADLTIKLKAGGALIGNVTVEGTNQPVKATKISLRHPDSGWTESVTTDDKGYFQLMGVFTDTIYATVNNPDYVAQTDVPIQIGADEPTRHDFKLSLGKTIEGIVYDEKGQSLTGALVKCGPRERVTDEIGRFEMTGFDSQRHSIQVIAEGYLTHHRAVNLSGSRDKAEVKIKLGKGATITGIVLDEGGTPQPDVEIKVFESSGNANWSYMYETGQTRYVTKSDEEGLFTVTGLQQRSWGGYRLRARKSGFADYYSKEIKFSNSKKQTHITAVITAGGTIAGVVYDHENQPLPGVKVSLAPASVHEWSGGANKSAKVAVSDEKGKFSFDRLGEQTYRVSAMAKGFATQYKNNLRIVGTSHLDNTDFNLEAGEPIRGTVKDEDGKPLPGAKVNIYSNRSWGQALTDGEGRYQITNVSEGPFTARAQLAGYSIENKRKVYPDNGEINFELKHDGYVWGEVIDASTEKPVKSFYVALQQKRQGRNTWRTKKSLRVNDPKGRFKIYAPDGSYRLRITSQGHIPHEEDNVSLSVSAEPEEKKIKLVPGGAIEGWINDHTGQPLGNVTVYVRDDTTDGKFLQKGSTEADGYFYLGSLKEGRYDLAFNAWGRLPVTFKEAINILGGDLREVRVRTDEPTTVYVDARRKDGKRMRYAKVSIENVDGLAVTLQYKWTRGKTLYELRSKKDYWLRNGRALTITDLPAGNYLMTVTASGLETIRREFSMAEGTVMEYDLEMVVPKKKTASSTNR